MTMRFEDPAAEFVPVVERVFGIEAAVRAAKELLEHV